MKRILTALLAAAICLNALAQALPGGITAKVVSRAGRSPIAGALVTVSQEGRTIATAKSAADGGFLIGALPDGIYRMTVSADGFAEADVNVTVEGYVKDLMFVSMVAEKVAEDVDNDSFIEFDMDDSGYTDTPTILFASTDPYTNVAGYGFSSIRFKNRGYESDAQDVYLAGIKLNDALSGYSPYSLWNGLNEAARSKESTNGVESSEYGVGGYNGITNIFANPASMRQGTRTSVLTNSSLYRLRLMASYASGELDNGWSYAANVSARLGGNDWVEGVYYKNFSYYVGAEKKFNDEHRLSLFSFAASGERGAQNSSTQEVYDLMGSNFYNSNWGYQNGKVRNARVRKTFEPVTVLKYTWTPSFNLSTDATLLWRTGKNGYTALDWYDAPDPRPDYYRNLPSYAWNDDEDYGKVNDEKAAWLTEAWSGRTSEYAKYQHIDWDRLYNVNYASEGGRSKYVQEERRVDQNDLHAAFRVKYDIDDNVNLTGGVNGRWNLSENYKIIADLLGGKYYLNIDQYAERDYSSDPEKQQNDLEYYKAHGEAQKLVKGDKYGYDYNAHVMEANAWAILTGKMGNLTLQGAGNIGYKNMWREGLVQKGLFPDNSKGDSEHLKYMPFTVKGMASYFWNGGHRVYADLGFFNEAPTFNESFVSARTRNTVVPNLTTTKSASADLNYQYSNSGWAVRATAFYTKIWDQTDVMSFYDDSQNSFTNFAMSGIDERHAGVELGVKVPLPVTGLSLSGVLSWGNYVYTSTPHMVQTLDNSSEVVYEGEVKYWQSTPTYRIAKTLEDGTVVYDQDANGYIVKSEKKHYVPSTPQLASELALNYRTSSYWFFELNGQYFANSYLDMNPLYRTAKAVGGPDGVETPAEVSYMTSQEKFDPAFLLNASIGKSWYIQRKYQLGFSFEMKNILNNTSVKTGGYEATRLITSSGYERYYKFDPKYYYMFGANYMLNIYFKF